MRTFLNQIKQFYTELSFNPLTWGNNNFHVVSDKKIYRSKTLSKKSLLKIVDAHGIKTILLLRAENPQATWYQEEIKIVREKNLTFIAYPLNAQCSPSKEQVRRLYELFCTIKFPVLIHCKAGADRTGMVCALWHLFQGSSLEQALQEQTLKQCHMRWRYPYMRKTTKHLHALYKQHGTIEKALEFYNQEHIK
jgi:protein tyrosine/serine phosphatase